MKMQLRDPEIRKAITHAVKSTGENKVTAIQRILDSKIMSDFVEAGVSIAMGDLSSKR